MKKNISLMLIAMVVFALALTACGTEATPTPDLGLCPEPTPCPEPVAEGPDVPYLEMWLESGHADVEAEAFRHWDEDGAVEPDCAKCHSTYGYQDYLGADGTEFGVIDAEGFPTDSTVECVACHNEATMELSSVIMPSGVEITGLGAEARCMQCHQGRAWGGSIDEAVADAEPDTVIEGARFTNIHYFAAAATKLGALAKGGYQYPDQAYDGEFAHVPEFDTCQECHNPHTLELNIEACAGCHEGVAAVEDLYNIRMVSSSMDYDGDGDVEEGVYFEIVGLQEALYAAIQAYGDNAGTPIVYDAATYPYFFDDAGENFASWTPRLLKAAYNYQLSIKDPGGFAHGGKYIIQLLADSIADLGGDIAAFDRIDAGHFAGSQEAFRHWDEDGEVEADCAKCHSAEGLPFFFENGVNVAAEISNGFLCETCHNTAEWPARYAFNSVTFASGKTVSAEEPSDEFLCMQCHQGRSSGATVDAALAKAGATGDDDPVTIRFQNVHYFSAGATRNGTDAGVGYEFAGQTYAGYFAHATGFESCTSCHDPHELEVNVTACQGCHGTDDVAAIRMNAADWDGDGAEEGVAGEIETLRDLLYAAIQAYGDAAGTPIVYDAHSYPYFFDSAGESFAAWTPNLLKAAYNLQYAYKDPGGFAHNGAYVAQLLIDSIEAVGGDLTGITRP